MKNVVLFLFLMLAARVGAHQPDVSATMLMEREDGSWVLKISSSVTAFQALVKARFSENAYASVEEFQRLVVQHVRENIAIYANRQDTLQLGNAFVKVGHETTVVFEVNGMPENVESVAVKNSSFKNIHGNQSALVILKKGVSQERFVLNNDNGHNASLVLEGGKFKLVGANQSRWASSNLSLGLGILCFGILGAIFLWSLFFKTSCINLLKTNELSL